MPLPQDPVPVPHNFASDVNFDDFTEVKKSYDELCQYLEASGVPLHHQPLALRKQYLALDEHMQKMKDTAMEFIAVQEKKVYLTDIQQCVDVIEMNDIDSSAFDLHESQYQVK